jgi:TolA-binding protein
MSQALQELSRGVRDEQDRAIESRKRPPVEERLAAIHGELGRRSVSRGRAPYWAALAGVAAAACVLLWWVSRPAAPLTVARGGQPVQLNAWLQSAATAEALSFSDGTQVRLSPEAALRVLALHATGASLALERGKLRANVVHRDDTRWLIAAGPFEVHVTGTEFDASYDPVQQVLDVQMFEGSVRVTGSCLNQPALLAGHESATFRCTAPRAVAGEASASEKPAGTLPAADDKKREEVPSSDKLGVGRAAPSAGASDVPPAQDWRALAREGHFKAALAAAEKRGFAALCASESAAALLELGNTARLSGNAIRASEAYLAVRSRFGGSGAASDAAFQLGRISFDGVGNYAAAQRWFRTYLSEAPGGALAQVALGRVMECEHNSGQRAQAEQTATQYLARYPKGAHASLAQSLIPE